MDEITKKNFTHLNKTLLFLEQRFSWISTFEHMINTYAYTYIKPYCVSTSFKSKHSSEKRHFW
jgi:hypothetical protein